MPLFGGNLCAPAYFYFVVSLIAIIIMAIQNFGNTNTYCLGDYECNVSSTWVIFFIKVMVVLLWTWILNLLCKAGASYLSWFLVILPYLIMFIALGLMFI